MGKGVNKKRTGWISCIIWMLNIIAAGTMLASYLSSYVDPEITTIFAFLGLGYLVLMVLNLLFLLYWLIRGRRKLLMSFIVLLIGYQPFVHHMQILPGREAPEQGVIKMLSYNVQNMTHNNLGIEKAEVRSGIINFLGSQDADIACMQEFAVKNRDFDGAFESVKELTHFEYCYYTNYNNQKTFRIEALVILSQYQAIDTGMLSVPGDHHQFGMYADLLIHGDTIRVYNLHLASVRLQHEDYQFVEDVSKGQAQQLELRKGSSSILRKLHVAFMSRSKQAKVVIESMAECPYPIILCGDFNDTPLSYAYHKISHELEDAFVNAGHGLGNTFAGNLPPVRIDFILYSPGFNAYEFKVSGIPLSDHYPVSVYLQPN